MPTQGKRSEGDLKRDVFDSASLWDRIDGDLELLRDLIAAFEGESPVLLEQIELAIRRGAAVEVRKASHKIKGSVLQFSAGPAVVASQQLEEMGDTGSLSGAEEALTRLRHEIDALMEALHAMVLEKAAQ